MTEREQILADLEPLFVEAGLSGKWFHCSYQDLWFSPAELRKCHAAGRFIWGRVNWELRDPKQRVREAEARVAAAQRELDALRVEIP